MTLLEMQILFQTIVEETNPTFFSDNRVDSYDIVNYLNQSSIRYVQKKYLPYPTFRQNHKFISENMQDMAPLLKTRKVTLRSGSNYMRDFGISSAGTPHANNYGDSNQIFELPVDFMFILGANLYSSKGGEGSDNPMYYVSNEYQECKFVTPDNLQRYLSTPIHKPLMREPMILMREPKELVLFYDDYTDTGSLFITYLRRPFKLSFDYTEVDTLQSAWIGENVRVLSGSRIYYPANNVPSNGFVAGDEMRVLNGYYTMWAYFGMDKYVGYPALSTNESELPEYMHEDIVRLAVQMLLDEARFKLITKKAEA